MSSINFIDKYVNILKRLKFIQSNFVENVGLKFFIFIY